MESIHNEEDEVQEGTELGCLVVVGAFGKFKRPEEEVESQLEQVDKLSGFGFGDDGRYGHDGVDNAKGDRLLSFDRRVLNDVGFELNGGKSAQSGVGLDVCRLSWAEEAIQEVGLCNCPPCLRNRLFPKSVHLALGVLGMSNPVSIYLQDFNSREG